MNKAFSIIVRATSGLTTPLKISPSSLTMMNKHTSKTLKLSVSMSSTNNLAERRLMESTRSSSGYQTVKTATPKLNMFGTLKVPPLV